MPFPFLFFVVLVAEVVLQGAQVRIKEVKFSLSSIPYDLMFDKYASFHVITDAKSLVTAAPSMCSALSLRDRPGLAGDIAVIYIEHADVEHVRTKKDKSFEKLTMTVCDESTGSRFHVLVFGPSSSVFEGLLHGAAAGDSLVLRGLSIETVSGGWRAVLKKGGSLSVNAGTPEDFLQCAHV